MPSLCFTTNASETANFILKNKVDNKQSQLLEFVDKLEEIIDDQEREVENITLNLNTSILKFLRISGTNDASTAKKSVESHYTYISHWSKWHIWLSFSSRKIFWNYLYVINCCAQVASEVSLPHACLQGIWTKANGLLSTADSTVPAPGCDSEAWLAISWSVWQTANFRSLRICSHTVVVAQLNAKLLEFVACFKKASKKTKYDETCYTWNALRKG